MPFLSRAIASSLLLIAVTLSGCGIYHYDYNVTPTLKGQPGKSVVTVVGVDDRNRDKPGAFKPYYVGLFRDIMIAVPYFIYTKGRTPLADILANDVALGLKDSGYRAQSVPNPSIENLDAALAAGKSSKPVPSRILVVRVYEFESDSQLRTEFGYTIGFEVYDIKGKLIASSKVQDLKMYGPAFGAYYFAQKNLPRKIKEALSEGVSPLMKDL
ncbi:MAG: hypothetical protein J0I10_09375 [Verrucomicrobia bacterium]|nr:hypothetical protein [Verrucomicrobiota bacterium]